MEIITGVERRRRWSGEDRARIVAETEEPGSSVAIVARRYDISRGLVRHWRRALRSTQPSATTATFLPVRVTGPSRGEAPIEIAFAHGIEVRIGNGADPALLRQVLAILRA